MADSLLRDQPWPAMLCDWKGGLITEGPGAGTPGVWSPTTDFWKHQRDDVQTWLHLGSAIYNQFWVPNRVPSSEERPCRGSDH